MASAEVLEVRSGGSGLSKSAGSTPASRRRSAQSDTARRKSPPQSLVVVRQRRPRGPPALPPRGTPETATRGPCRGTRAPRRCFRSLVAPAAMLPPKTRGSPRLVANPVTRPARGSTPTGQTSTTARSSVPARRVRRCGPAVRRACRTDAGTGSWPRSPRSSRASCNRRGPRALGCHVRRLRALLGGPVPVHPG